MVKKKVVQRDGKFKSQLVLQWLSGAKTAEELCLEYGVKRSSLYRWRQQVLENVHTLLEGRPGRPPASEQSHTAELERMVGRLTMENEVLKKASSMLNSRSRKDEP